MTIYTPISKVLPQYVDSAGDPYAGAVLKPYRAGTSTPINFSLDDLGTVLVGSIALNASGYPVVSGNIVLPHIAEKFKLSLYPDQASADINSGAIWTIDNISILDVNAGGEKIVNVADGTDLTDAINVGQVQESQFLDLGITAGSADQYQVTTAPTFDSYVATMFFVAKIHISNLTTTPYLQLNSIASPGSNAVIKKQDESGAEIAVEVGDLNGVHEFKRNSANDAWIVLNPYKPYLDAINMEARQATESLLGSAELATQDEADDGDNDDKIITPLKLKTRQGVRYVGRLTASSSVSLEQSLESGKSYLFKLTNISPSVDGSFLTAQYSSDGGATIINSNYLNICSFHTSVDPLVGVTNKTTGLTLTGSDGDANTGVGSASTGGVNGYFEIFDPSDASKHKQSMWAMSTIQESGYPYLQDQSGCGVYQGSPVVIDHIKFSFKLPNSDTNSGLIDSGFIDVWEYND